MNDIADKRILVVEDEFLIAQALVDAIQSGGAIAVGPAATIERANALLDAEPIEAAVVDLNLRGNSNEAMTEKSGCRQAVNRTSHPARRRPLAGDEPVRRAPRRGRIRTRRRARNR